MVLHCFKILEAEDLSKIEQFIACLMVFYEDFNDVEDVLSLEDTQKEQFVKAMFDFMSVGEKSHKKESIKLMDWEKDSLLITSAINSVAGKEIRAEKYLHWWTFVGYYMAIGDCAMSQIVAIRHKIAKSEKLEKHERKFKQENPEYFDRDYRTLAQKEADNYIENLWNGGENT